MSTSQSGGPRAGLGGWNDVALGVADVCVAMA